MRSGRLAAVPAILMAAAACGGGGGGGSHTPAGVARNPARFVEGQRYEPAFDPTNFVDLIDNPYFPLQPGTTFVYRGESDGERETTKFAVTTETKDILGIAATVVRDQVFAGGELKEDTFDWFGQDREGNVWYVGEDTKEYEKGEVVTTEGSWEAGVDGAQPGIIMLADPQAKEAYRQEFYEGQAEDVARVIRLDGSVTVPYGSFDGVLVTGEFTPLEPAVLENKYYARGVGVVYEEQVRGGEGFLRLVEVREP